MRQLLLWFIFSTYIFLCSSCYVTKTTPLYHEFTNELDVAFDRELFDIDVRHQLNDQHMVIRMTNLSDSDYLFNWSRSALVLNEVIIPFRNTYVQSEYIVSENSPMDFESNISFQPVINMDEEKHIALLPSGQVYEVLILLNKQIKDAGIQLSDTSKQIAIETRLTFSNTNQSEYYTNTYNLNRIQAFKFKKDEPGLNTLVTEQYHRKIDAQESVNGFLRGVVTTTLILATFTFLY